jgi:hypothetical protein
MESHSSTTHHANKTQHNKIFTSWLVQRFGQHVLRKGNGVLDIAGGNGIISFELTVHYGITSTLYEPRTNVTLSSMLRRKLKKITRLRSSGMLNIHDVDMSPMAKYIRSVSLQPIDDGVVLPCVLKCLQDETTSEMSKEIENEVVSVESKVLNLDTTKQQFMPFNHIEQEFPLYLQDILQDKNLSELILSSSVLIGVHPDEATEAIIDAAIYFRIPFAIVPCCLHSSAYPSRKTVDGRIVNSYELFIEYLMSKHRLISRVVLPFIGRNICLFCDSFVVDAIL